MKVNLTPSKQKILVIDDEPNIVELVKFHLEREGYEVITGGDGLEAITLVRNEQPDLVVLDVMLPKLDGFEVCRQLRLEQNQVPVIMLTAKEDEISRVLGLEIGADDYITKPFSPRELIARIKTIFRRLRPKETPHSLISYRRLSIDLNKYQAMVDNQTLTLTAKEFDLLALLARNPGQVFTRDFLLDKLWGYTYYGDTRTVDVHIRRLRQKLTEFQIEDYIETVRGVGYKLKED